MDLVAARARFAHGAHVVDVIGLGDAFDGIICSGIIDIVVGRRGFDRRFADQFHRRAAFEIVVQINRFQTGRIIARGHDSIAALDSGCAHLAARAAAGLFGRVFCVFLGLEAFGIGAFFGHQRLAVGDRDLIVVGMDFRKCKKAMPVSAVIDESGLQRWFDPSYLCKIDVASQLAFELAFKIKFFDLVAVHHHDAGFLRMGGIDKHFLWHFVHSHMARLAPRGVRPSA